MEIRDNPGAARFEAWIGDERAGVIDYVVDGARMVLPHTEVASRFKRHGVGNALVRAALDSARVRGCTVDPQCWFVAEFIAHNAAYADLL